MLNIKYSHANVSIKLKAQVDMEAVLKCWFYCNKCSLYHFFYCVSWHIFDMFCLD